MLWLAITVYHKWSMAQLIPAASSFPICLAMKYHKDMTNIKHFVTQFPGHFSGSIYPYE